MMEEHEVTQEQAEKWIREQYQRPDEETAAREVLDASVRNWMCRARGGI